MSVVQKPVRLAIALSACLLVSTAQADPIPGPQRQLVNSTLWQQHAPEYALISRATFAAATAALKSALASRGSAAIEQPDGGAGKPPAVIVDLDETMLDNSPYQAWLARRGVEFSEPTWDAWIALKQARALPGAIEFANAAVKSGKVTLFYVSNRECKDAAHCPNRSNTMENMAALGFPGATDPSRFLFKVPGDPRGDKVTRRKQIAEKHRIVMLVGDDMRDILPQEDVKALADPGSAIGRRAGDEIGKRWFILPNAMYGGWLSGLGKTADAQFANLRAAPLPAADAPVLASWNLAWLLTPATYDELLPACRKTGQIRSNERAIPCTPGRDPIPQRQAADFDALATVAGRLHADVVALQEVDGPAAAAMVFRQGWKVDCFVSRAHVQKVGFAIREGIPYQCNPEFAALDVDGASRAGADLTLYPGTPQAVRLLGVHLKSGCVDGSLKTSTSEPCKSLRRQVPVVEQWVDARAAEGGRFAVLGDFNRALDQDAKYSAGPDEAAPASVFRALSDGKPAGAVLRRATERSCFDGDPHDGPPIDNILVSQSLAEGRTLDAAHLRYDKALAEGRILSDHCPILLRLQ
ncbi:HAD family acid phosphatase [Pseudoduganella umbonata]|nr:HAD family acid phosphatase [Pseudoduganella umbonata]MBB3224974.1 5'-nucleotidase (lipoprotein e(P4) family) [Pseudoduganella umbonata]